MTQGGESALRAESAHPAIEDYHAYLTANSQLAADSHDRLQKLSVGRFLTFGGVPFSRYLRPHFVTPGQYAFITDVVETLARAMVILRRAILADENLFRQLDLTPEERRLALIDPGFEEPSPSARLDSFWSERDWRFVEMNAESPAAIAYGDSLADVFLELPALSGWCRERGYRVTPLYATPRFMRKVDDVWREFQSHRGGDPRDKPNVAIIDWDGVPTSSEFELFKRHFESREMNTIIADPRALEFRGGKLYAGDFRIDIYYKRVLTSELLEKPEAAQATIKAYEAGAICMINTFRAKLLHKKMSLALLHDEANHYLFGTHEIETIKRHIPWTRKVAEGKTLHEDKEVDLIPFIAENRERLVLKPNDEYGGKGVVIGWVTDDAEWQKSLAEALESSYVVQGAVQLDQEPYPLFDSSTGLVFHDLTADLDPFVFGTDMQGILTRLSSAALLNVTAGTGSVVPTMIVQKTQ